MLWLLLRARDALSHQKARLFLGIALFAIALFLFGNDVLAATPSTAEAGSFSSPAGDWVMESIGDIALKVAQLVLSITVAMLDVLIALLTYNGFGTSTVVAVGWAVVRDVVNLFFVVVLIIIAFGTILGVSRFNWIQQVPRLLLFAIVINFSKTLASLMIDIGQVITLTFANAIKDIAAGNFIQLFGINEIFNISTTSGPVADVTTPGAEGIQGFDLFAAGLAALALAVWIGIVVFIMLLIFALRIVMLWVLIILAPLAWFIGGIKDVVHSKAYDTWWAKFTCWVAIGPVLTFFLWLALAVAGSGNIAVTEGMTSDADVGGGVSGLILSIFESHRFMSFVLGMAMLMAGFEAAQEVCQGASGFVSGALGKARTAAIGAIGGYAAGRAVKAGGDLALKGAKYGAKAPFKLGWAGVKTFGGRRLVAGMENTRGLRWVTKKGRATAARELAKKTGMTSLAGFAGKIADSAEAGRRKDMAESIEGFDTRASKTEYLNTFAKQAGKKGWKNVLNKPSVLQKKRATAMLQQVMGDDDAIEGLEATGAMGDLWQQVGGDKLKKEFAGDAGMLEKIEDFEKKHVNISGKTDKINDWDKVKKMSDRSFEKFGQDEELKKQLRGINSGIKGKDGRFNSTGQTLEQWTAAGKEEKTFAGEFLDADQAIRGGHGVNTKKAKYYKGEMTYLQGKSESGLKMLSDAQVAQNMDKESAKNPELAVRAMKTGDSKLLRQITSDPAMYQNLLHSSLGIDEAAGKVNDSKLLESNFKQNPEMLASMRRGTVVEFQNDLAKSFDKGGLTKVIAHIKKNPTSESSKVLYRNMEIVLKAKGDKELEETFTSKLKGTIPEAKQKFNRGREIEQAESAISAVETEYAKTRRAFDSKGGGAQRQGKEFERQAIELRDRLHKRRDESTDKAEFAKWDKHITTLQERLDHVRKQIVERDNLEEKEEGGGEIGGGGGGSAGGAAT